MLKGTDFLPYGRQQIDDDDIAAVVNSLRGELLTTGPAVKEFESALADATGARFAVVCSSGTAALHLAALAAELGPGDRSVVPTMTFLATANAARFAGAEVLFADVDQNTGLLTAESLTASLDRSEGQSVKAIFPVHLNGQVAPMEQISQIAGERGLMIVEDACHALGGTYRTSANEVARVGDCRFSDMAVFSFHPVKTITTGEGGAVTTNSPELAQRLRELRNHGMVRDPVRFSDEGAAFDRQGEANPWYYEMVELGNNYRLSDIHCALGLSQLSKLARFRSERAALTRQYDELISPLFPDVRPVPREETHSLCLHLYPVLIDFKAVGKERANVMKDLAEQGIGTQVHYIPVHWQPYYRHRYGSFDLPGARRYYERALSLPFFAGMDHEAPARVTRALSATLNS